METLLATLKATKNATQRHLNRIKIQTSRTYTERSSQKNRSAVIKKDEGESTFFTDAQDAESCKKIHTGNDRRKFKITQKQKIWGTTKAVNQEKGEFKKMIK